MENQIKQQLFCNRKYTHSYKVLYEDDYKNLHTCEVTGRDYKSDILIIIEKEKSVNGFNEEEFAFNLNGTTSPIKRLDRFKEGLFNAYFTSIGFRFIFDWTGKAFIRVRKNDGKIIGYKVFIKNETFDFSEEFYKF